MLACRSHPRQRNPREPGVETLVFLCMVLLCAACYIDGRALRVSEDPAQDRPGSDHFDDGGNDWNHGGCVHDES